MVFWSCTKPEWIDIDAQQDLPWPVGHWFTQNRPVLSTRVKSAIMLAL